MEKAIRIKNGIVTTIDNKNEYREYPVLGYCSNLYGIEQEQYLQIFQEGLNSSGLGFEGAISYREVAKLLGISSNILAKEMAKDSPAFSYGHAIDKVTNKLVRAIWLDDASFIFWYSNYIYNKYHLEISCLHCGIHFDTKQTNKNKRIPKFCSKNCYVLHQQEQQFFRKIAQKPRLRKRP